MATTTKQKSVKLGQAVEYVSTTGKTKMALVTGTPETIVEGTRVPTLTEGQVHLAVYSIATGWSSRLNVPSAESVSDNDGFRDSDGNAIGVYRVIA